MGLVNGLIIGLGVVIFLGSFSQRGSYVSGGLLFCLGIVLVYWGLKREENEKKIEMK